MRLAKYIYLTGMALLMSACHLEAPETPTEELYLRNFIKQFGLIDPNQDWNLAEQSEVYVLLPSRADKVVVYAEVFDDYYRVARCYDVDAGAIRIPLDVPVNTTSLAVEVDGNAYLTSLGGKVDLSASKGESREDSSPTVPWSARLEDNTLGWVIVAEDLGSTDDVDFNDIVVRMSYDENSYYAYGQVTPDRWDVIDQQINNDDIYISRDSRDGASGNTVVTIKALAAGGVLKLWLHYTTGQGTGSGDWIIGPTEAVESSLVDSESEADPFEWHRWFGLEDGVMINTASGDHSFGNDHNSEEIDYTTSSTYLTTPICGAETTFEVPGTFSFATYSQLTYSDGNPLISYNFSFDRRTIEGFYITVSDYHKAEIDAYDIGKVIGHNRNQGLPPQMFLVPDLCAIGSGSSFTAQNHFRWPTERTQIDVAYSKFDDWVKYGTTEWYQYGREDCVVSDSFISKIYGTSSASY